MAKSISRDLITTYSARWQVIGELQIRADVAKRLNIAAPNLDKMVGLPHSTSGGSVAGLLPSPQLRKTGAAADFSKAMTRYASLTKLADQLAEGSKTRKPAVVNHLRQAALVLGVGSFDAYIKSFVVEKYLERMFATPPMPGKMHSAWTLAIKEAVTAQPDILTEVARLPPPRAKQLLAEKVFEVHQVRLVTSNFGAAIGVLQTVDIELGVHAMNPTVDPAQQFLQLARPIFDAYAQARHWIVHTGTSSRGTAVPYCASQVPQRFLGDFLGGVVSMVEAGGMKDA